MLFMRQMAAKSEVTVFLHSKCLRTDIPYLRSHVFRAQVPVDKVEWNAKFDQYNPVEYTDPGLNGKSYADVDVGLGPFKWNELDGSVDRRSHMGVYKINEQGRPLNPMGRTGLSGRGVLGRWGPNHAADPIVSRLHNGQLQFVAIQRHDTGEWALPGGMVDPGEQVSVTLKREFTEETLDGVENAAIARLWSAGVEVYRGYVDDPRNTDNAWMETVAVNFHDRHALLDQVQFRAGDDAKNVRFVDVKPGIRLYASHYDLIRRFAKLHNVSIE